MYPFFTLDPRATPDFFYDDRFAPVGAPSRGILKNTDIAAGKTLPGIEQTQKEIARSAQMLALQKQARAIQEKSQAYRKAFNATKDPYNPYAQKKPGETVHQQGQRQLQDRLREEDDMRLNDFGNSVLQQMLKSYRS